MAQYRVRLLTTEERQATIRRRRRTRWILKVSDPKVGGFGYLPVSVLDGDLAGYAAQGHVISKPGKRLKIKGTSPFRKPTVPASSPTDAAP